LDCIHLFRFGHSSDAGRADIPHANIREGSILIPVREIKEGSNVHLGATESADSGGHMPHADQLVGMGIGERLEQDTFNDTEDCGIGSDADGQG
jgi:hypothetical protein